MKSQKKLSVVLLAFVTTLVGCGTVVSNLVAMQMPHSKYMPVFTSEKSVDDWIDIVRPVSGKVVSDELGTYFHKSDADNVFTVFLSKDDGDAIKRILAGDVGLLEPLYTFDANAKPIPDWSATERRHDYLTKKSRLKLRPIDDTKKYHQLITEFAKMEAKRHSNSGGFSAASAALSGDYGLYNLRFAENVLDKIGGNFQYIVKDAWASNYYADIVTRASGGISPPPTASSYRYLTNLILAHSGLNIVPKDFYSSKVKGDIRIDSGCSVVNASTMKAMIRGTKEMSDVPYFSAVKSAMKDKNTSSDDLLQARGKFKEAVVHLERVRESSESACSEGFPALQVSGAIQSQRLK